MVGKEIPMKHGTHPSPETGKHPRWTFVWGKAQAKKEKHKADRRWKTLRGSAVEIQHFNTNGGWESLEQEAGWMGEEMIFDHPLEYRLR